MLPGPSIESPAVPVPFLESESGDSYKKMNVRVMMASASCKLPTVQEKCSNAFLVRSVTKGSGKLNCCAHLHTNENENVMVPEVAAKLEFKGER
jgi:hypothetical protein